MQARMIYITCQDKEEAQKIGKALVQKRLVACVNILTGMQSMYWWEGEVQSDEEVVLIAKSTDQHTKQLIEEVKSQHSYSVPCIVSIPILDGNPDYLKWIQAETGRA